MTLTAWLGALCAAAYPTWEHWRPYVGERRAFFCVGSYFPDANMWQPLVLPLRADADMLVGLGVTWAVPAVVVLVALGHWRSAVAGRRAAAVLAATAVAGPLVAMYFDSDACAFVPLFSGQWFVEVVDRASTDSTVLALLVAAVLVLLATRGRPEPDPRPAGRAARWTAAILIDYWMVVTIRLLLPGVSWESGLLAGLTFPGLVYPPEQLLVLLVIILYLLPRRTLGIWLTGLRR
ncbi:hypothetical protein [Nonomuraea aridisoli]|uniref:hypothetical protein n=1 Tax=Nonomuraea aridisoli TaxID=2070368 RepID=UPI0015E8E4EB|nr:hypothetical protein [Nonomuraea aridisoli]